MTFYGLAHCPVSLGTLLMQMQVPFGIAVAWALGRGKPDLRNVAGNRRGDRRRCYRHRRAELRGRSVGLELCRGRLLHLGFVPGRSADGDAR
jgi:hypothetical protein